MSEHSFFNRPKVAVKPQIQPTPIDSEPEPQPRPEPQPEPQPEIPLLDDWMVETELPNSNIGSGPKEPEPEPEPEVIESPEPEVVSSDQMLDEESAEVWAEVAADINNSQITNLINWMNGNKDFRGATNNQIQKLQHGYKLVLRALKYQPSPYEALAMANFAAFGNAAIGAVFTLISRIAKGAVRLPWQASKRVVQMVKPSEPEPEHIEPEESAGTKTEKETGPVKHCLYDQTPFRGSGFPKTSKVTPELVGKFKNKSNYTAFMNEQKKKGKGKAKSEENDQE